MKSTSQKFTALTLGLLLSCPWHTFTSVQAQSLKELRAQQQTTKPAKLAPDLEEILAQDDEDARQAMMGKTLAQVRQERRARARVRPTSEAEETETRTRINEVLLPSSAVGAEEKQSFIVQLDGSTPNIVLQEKVARLGGRIKQTMGNMGLVTIEAPRTAIRQLAAEGSVAYVSPDREIAAFGHVVETTGYWNAGISDKGDQDTNTWLNGSGVSVAVLDSGVAADHRLMQWVGWGTKVKSIDLTGQNINGDPYGHGSHVASLVAGEYDQQNGSYAGAVGGGNVLSVRVLDSNGKGTASTVIAGIDWCIANKQWYTNGNNIRVLNLSLGTIAKDSYKTDPLCLAARRAVNAGIVVIASAGNNGKDANGKKIYGAINSPGIDPSVITVGAANTIGTNYRSDDVVASYSSRGPTRGYTTVNGVRKYDNLIKPDLIAPGNKLIGARAYYNGTENTLARTNTSLRTGTETLNTEKVMYLSGTSMAAPVVASAAALLMQTNPNLTPALVKAILMYTAQPLNGFNMLEQGAGELNIDGAVRVARLVKATLPTTNGTALLKAALPTSQTSTIYGETFKWSQGVITNYGFLSGSNLMTYWQGVYGTGQVLGDATAYSSSTVSLVSGKTYSVTLKAGAYTIKGSGVILGDSTNTLFASGTILGDGQVLGDGTILGDGATRADSTLKSSSGASILGDNTACMKPVP